MTDEIQKKPPKTDRIEIFAQAIVDGKTQADAYRAAFPASLKWKADYVYIKASEMAKDQKVLLRVQELRKQMESKELWSRERSISILSEIAESKLEKSKDRITAVDKLNGMFGYNVLKIDHSSTDGSMSPKPLDASKLSEQTMKELLEAREQNVLP